MPAVRRAPVPMLLVVGLIFAGGLGFGAVVALTSPRKEEAKATTPDTSAIPVAPATEPVASPTSPAEPTRKAEPKAEPKKTPKTEPKKPEAPKAEPKKPEAPKTEPKKPEEISYVKQVFPILKAKCLMCHGDPQRKADVDFRTLASAVKGGSSGDGAVPGKPEKSSLWLAIEDNSMPPPGKEKMTDAEKKLVKDWILSGAK